jgi:hypothetical protein
LDWGYGYSGCGAGAWGRVARAVGGGQYDCVGGDLAIGAVGNCGSAAADGADRCGGSCLRNG